MDSLYELRKLERYWRDEAKKVNLRRHEDMRNFLLRKYPQFKKEIMSARYRTLQETMKIMLE